MTLRVVIALAVLFALAVFFSTRWGSPGYWYTNSQTDPISDSTTHAISVNGTGHTFTILCENNQLDFYIEWHSRFIDFHESTHRFDEDDPVTATWARSQSGSSLFYFEERAPFIDRLLASQRLTVRTVPPFGNSLTAQFNTSRLGEFIAPIRENCSW